MRKVATLDRGLAYGEGCFETFRVIDGRVFALPQHQQRLARAAAQFGWNIDAAALLDEAIVVAKAEGDDTLVRLTLSGGTAPWGILPASTTPNTWLQTMVAPSRSVLHLRTVDCGSILPRRRNIKCSADYADMLRIYQQSRQQLASHEQMLLSAKGTMVSTMTANIVLYHDGQWITPEDNHLLAGIVRALLLQEGLIGESPCCQQIAEHCQAMVCINSGVFVQAVASINGRALDVHGKLFQPLYNFFRHQTGIPACL